MSRLMIRSCVAAALAALAPAVAHAQAASIAGTVTDSISGAPITGARVGLSGMAQVATTNARGQYSITGLGSGDYTVIASAPNRASAIRTVHTDAVGSALANFKLATGSALLPGVVVSATRSPVAGRDVTATVHAMSSERIRTSTARTADDLLREMPGVELPRTSSTVSGPEEIVSIRGADEGRTLVLLDDVPLNDPWGEWIQWNRAPRFQLDHAEIVEGGGSSLYGNYAMGGVISLFSRPIAPRGYDVTTSGGSRGEVDASVYGSDVVGRLGYSVGADYGTGGGYRVLAPAQRGPVDRASVVTRRSVNGRAEYALDDATSIFARASYFNDDRKLGTPLTGPNQRDIASGTLGATIGSLLGGSLALRAFGQTQRYNSHASSVNASRTIETPIAAQHIPSRDLGASAEWSRRAGMFESVSLGGDFRYMTGRLDEDLFAPTGTVSGTRSSGTRSSGGSQQVGGVFAQGILAPVEALRVEASARIDGWRSYHGSRAENSATMSAFTSYPDRTNTAFAPRLGVKYALLPSLTLRGSLYQAFRAPTLSEEYRTFFAGPNTFMGNPLLTPEHLTGYDGGLDWQPSAMLELRATTFLNKYRDLDDFVFQRSGATQGSAILKRQNLGRARSKGIEGEVALRPVEHLGFVASYNYDDARVVSTGKFLNRVPLQRGSLRATYDDPRIADLNIVYRYEGSNHALGGARLEPFSVVDVDVRREILAGADIFVAVENIFDREYAVSFSGPLELIGLPRTIRGGVSVHSF